jgi:hypothetical protein
MLHRFPQARLPRLRHSLALRAKVTVAPSWQLVSCVSSDLIMTKHHRLFIAAALLLASTIGAGGSDQSTTSTND